MSIIKPFLDLEHSIEEFLELLASEDMWNTGFKRDDKDLDIKVRNNG